MSTATATTLAASAGVVGVNKSLTLTATVKPGSFSMGSGARVTFYNGGTAIGSAAVIAQYIPDPTTGILSAAGLATLSISTLAVGAHSLTAVFGGSSVYGASTSAAIAVTVINFTGTITTATLQVSCSTIAAGSPLKLTATIKPSGAYSDTVTFYDGAAAIGTAVLNSAGVASLVITTLPLGPHSITVSYPGHSTTLSASISAAVAVTVTPGLTLATPPGFVDVPDGLFAAGQLALGLYFQRVLDNAKFGIVRPEFFVADYKHGDTVDLPISAVDGYQYQRDELIYLWHLKWSGGVSSSSTSNGAATTTVLTANAPTGTAPVWYFGVVVDQITGIVSSYVKYIESNMTGASMSNDGMVEVLTIGVRRMTTLVLAEALPAFSDLPDSDFAVDAPVTQFLAQSLNRNAKLASLRHEAIYMGEFVHGDKVPLSVSPCDGYAYAYSEITFAWSWRWCSMTSTFGDPQKSTAGKFYNELQRFQASIDSSGNVSTSTIFYDSGEFPTNYGRLTVVALCQRGGMAASAEANVFTDISDATLAGGASPEVDVLKALDDAIRFAALRTEFFTGSYTNGQTVALPVSPIDGYTYSRDELTYHGDFATTGPNTHIRLATFGSSIDPITGVVSTVTNHVPDGGGFIAATDGTVNTLVIARRGHVVPSSGVTGSGSPGDYLDELLNPGFELWASGTNPFADDWTLGQQSGGAVGQRNAGIDGTYSQGMTVPAAGVLSFLSNSLDTLQGDIRYVGFKMASAVASTGGVSLRVRLYNADLSNTAYFDVITNQAITGSGTVQNLDGWYQVPMKDAATASTSSGDSAIVGTYDFVCSFAKLEILCATPSASQNLSIDSAYWDAQAPAAGVVLVAFGSMTPASVLSQAAATYVVAMAAFTVTWANGRTVSYTARNFTVSDPHGVPKMYYVTIADPTQVGDGGTTLTAYCDINATRANTPGYTFAGKIIVTHAGGNTGGPGGPGGINATLVVVA